MSEKQWFEVFSPKSCEVMAVPTILKMAIIFPKINKRFILKYFSKHKTPCFLDVALVFGLGASLTHLLQLSAASDMLDTSSMLLTKLLLIFRKYFDASRIH